MGLAEVIISLAMLIATGSCFYLAFRPPEARIERRLTARVKQLELEWDVTFEKIEALAGRLAKRDGLARRAQEKVELPVVPEVVASRSDLLKIVLKKERDGEPTQSTSVAS